MSPSKKKAAKKKAAKKKTAVKAKSAKSKKKAAGKKKAKKTAAKKAKPKKAAKAAAKTSAKKAAKKPAKKTAKAATKKAASKKAAAKKAAPKKAAKKEEAASKKKKKTKADEAPAAGKEKPAKRARPKKPVTPTGPRHPKLGYKWICFSCSAKFYDLGKEEPICPKCESDQRDRPPEDAKPSSDTPKPKVVRPMAQLLDDEEPAVSPDDDDASGPETAKTTKNEMFDDAEGDDAGLDIDDTDLVDAAVEPPEIDVL